MKVQQHNYPLPISEKLVEILEKEITLSGLDTSDGVILNFRDPDYDQESGGFHPVEIAVCVDGKIHYITDFSYVGMPPFAELAKELDFDFELKLFLQCGHEYSINQATEIYQLWQANFCSYYAMGIYQVTVASFR